MAHRGKIRQKTRRGLADVYSIIVTRKEESSSKGILNAAARGSRVLKMRSGEAKENGSTRSKEPIDRTALALYDSKLPARFLCKLTTVSSSSTSRVRSIPIPAATSAAVGSLHSLGYP
jgi:hypothetical protein